MARVMVNKMLESRGYKNMDPNFGFGKRNASWESRQVIIKREGFTPGNITITITAKSNKEVLGIFKIVENGERSQSEIDNMLRLAEKYVN